MHKHWPKDHPAYERAPWCPFRTLKGCDEAYANWQAEQQVALADRIVAEGGAPRYAKAAGVFGQLVQLRAGTRQVILSQDGNPSEAPFTRRLLAAVERRAA